MDVPEAARLTGAQVLASPQSIELLRILGVDGSYLRAISSGDVIECGDLRVEVYLSRHRRIFGGIPYLGPLRDGLTPPLRARDYRMDFQVSFRITAGDIRLLIASGIDDEPPTRAEVLLVGADATRRQLHPILDAVRPRLVLPNHWDDMFRPLTRPLRPMHVPPTGRIPSLRRISLDAFARSVCDLSPDSMVLIPRIFGPMDVEELIPRRSPE
jgi:L-ascorbate metabolism protein UlaG (beta-lactamase superfamily)